MSGGRPDVWKIDRRDFLKLGLAGGGGLVLAASLPGAAVLGRTARGAAAFEPGAFVRIDPDGTVTITVGKVDMGQGVRTALPMIVADELDAAWNSVRTVQADAHPDKYGRQMTVGSSSVRNGAWLPLRKAGAAAREMLLATAAARWGVPPGDCRTEAGRVIHGASGRELGYGELAEDAAGLPVPEEPRLKRPAEFRLIGTRVPLVDTPLKVTGRATFGMDVRVPGMRYATVRRPPMVDGVLESFDAATALRVPGVTEVVKLSAGVAVVADDTWAAFRGADALEIAWKPGGFDLDSEAISRRHAQLAEAGAGAVARRDGDPQAALEGAARRVEAVYEAPYLAHATMEPMNCTADVRRNRCEVWAPTQNPQGAQSVAARITGLPPERVDVHVTYMGCGWGRRGRTDYVEDAVEASMRVGAPVQVTWTREEDMRQDQYRPATYNRFRGGLDEAGRLVALDLCVAAPPVGVGWSGAGDETGVDRNAVDGLANMPYRVPNLFLEYCRSDIPVPTGYWRSVGPSQNTFTLESFIDELAHAGGRDPLAFRLELLEHHPRMSRVLEKAAAMAGWGSSPPEGRARGIGLVENKGGIVAQVAEVSRAGDGVRVHRVACAADCGRIIHPGIVEAQIEGSIVAGLTAALYGRITFERGRPVQSNFHDYPMLRMREMPEIEVHVVDSGEEPGGVGEPAVPPIAPAVTNALFALTGERVRSLPLAG